MPDCYTNEIADQVGAADDDSFRVGAPVGLRSSSKSVQAIAFSRGTMAPTWKRCVARQRTVVGRFEEPPHLRCRDAGASFNRAAKVSDADGPALADLQHRVRLLFLNNFDDQQLERLATDVAPLCHCPTDSRMKSPGLLKQQGRPTPPINAPSFPPRAIGAGDPQARDERLN
jgi:hypothetical protein